MPDLRLRPFRRHRVRSAARDISSGGNARSLRFKSTAYGLLKFFNGCLYHLTGRQLVVRYPGRMHAVHSPIFHTPRSMRRLLTRGGFRLIGDDAPAHPETAAFWSKRVSS